MLGDKRQECEWEWAVSCCCWYRCGCRCMADGCKKERYTSTKEKSRHQSSFLSIIISHSDLHSSDICDATFITSTYLHESFAHQPLWPEQGVHTAGLRTPLTKSFESSGLEFLARIFIILRQIKIPTNMPTWLWHHWTDMVSWTAPPKRWRNSSPCPFIRTLDVSKTSVLLSIWFANHLFDKNAEHENQCVRHNTNTSRIVSSLVSLIISYQHKPKAIMLRLLSELLPLLLLPPMQQPLFLRRSISIRPSTLQVPTTTHRYREVSVSPLLSWFLMQRFRFFNQLACTQQSLPLGLLLLVCRLKTRLCLMPTLKWLFLVSFHPWHISWSAVKKYLILC